MTLDEAVSKAASLLAEEKLSVEEIAKETGLNIETVKEIASQVFAGLEAGEL